MLEPFGETLRSLGLGAHSLFCFEKGKGEIEFIGDPGADSYRIQRDDAASILGYLTTK